MQARDAEIAAFHAWMAEEIANEKAAAMSDSESDDMPTVQVSPCM
jgi:hypothetical protein